MQEQLLDALRIAVKRRMIATCRSACFFPAASIPALIVGLLAKRASAAS